MLTSYGEQVTRPNPFRKPITLNTLPDLFAHHRAVFGGWRMEDDLPSGDQPPADPPAFAAITTQADLDRIIGTRLAREREKYADYDDLRAKAAEHDKALEAAKSDHEKAVEAARKEGESSALERANARLVSAEARALAAEARFRNTGLAVRGIDLADVKVGDDGTVDAEAIKAKLKALSDADPYLVDDGKKSPPKPDRSQGGGSDARPGKRLVGLAGDELYDRLHPKRQTAS